MTQRFRDMQLGTLFLSKCHHLDLLMIKVSKSAAFCEDGNIFHPSPELEHVKVEGETFNKQILSAWQKLTKQVAEIESALEFKGII